MRTDSEIETIAVTIKGEKINVRYAQRSMKSKVDRKRIIPSAEQNGRGNKKCVSSAESPSTGKMQHKEKSGEDSDSEELAIIDEASFKKAVALSTGPSTNNYGDHEDKGVKPKEEDGENNTIPADNATSGEELPANNNVENEAEDNAGNGDMPAVDAVEKKKLSSFQGTDLFEALANSVLGRGPLVESDSEDESEQALKNTALPLKFRLEDETDKMVEKTESEKEVDALMAEASAIWESLSNPPEVRSKSECSPDNLEARCARGEHDETIQDEVLGVYCIHCGHVVLGPEDLIPQWADKLRRKPVKKISANTDKLPKFANKCHAEPSAEKTDVFVCPSDGTVLDIKSCVRTMYKHQQEGFEFLWKNLAGSTDIAELKNMAKANETGGCIICHAPGTGKTRLTIVFLETYLTVFPDSRPVIVAPASMLLTWEEELEKWDFSFPVYNLNNREFTGDESKSASKSVSGPKCNDKDMVRLVKLYSWDKGGSVLIISYSLFEKLTGKIQAGENKKKQSRSGTLGEMLLEKPGLVILDEGHTARNESANLWNVLLKLKTEKRVILSGTPFQNNFSELFNTLKLVRPAVTKDKALFRINASKKRKHNQSGPISETIDGAELEKLKHAMLPFVNIHKGTKLNGLGESLILLKPSELQERLIKSLEGQNISPFESKVALTSVHPNLVLHCKKPEEQNIDTDTISVLEASRLNPLEGAKTKFIIELLRLSVAAKEKVLIFSQYIAPLELIKDQLKEVFQWNEGKQILHIEGKLGQKIRQNLLNSYNDPSSEARVMLASIKCCFEGISLVGASRVVLLDVVWNPSVERQAICRAYRIGQKKFVHTYHLMTNGTTEFDKYRKQVDKERISELVFCSSNGESDKGKAQVTGSIEKDTILEEMATSATLADMFVKIIHQPKDTDIFQNFGPTLENSNEA